MEKFTEKEIAGPKNPKWDLLISRQQPLYKRDVDFRSDFERDYTRIIYSDAYKRLKHKTQVFYSPSSDHICTRIEHVNNVESVSYTIAKVLGLNTSLTKVISCAHDLGHSPFGHKGESILSEISQKELGEKFWHEKNGLDIVDSIELLEDCHDHKQNLNLTYAVRDGIISHCGEIDESFLKPRNEYIDLENYKEPNQYAPFTWEACVVKIADKVSYIRRDIEDAISLGMLDNDLTELYDLLQYPKDKKINNTNLTNELICDLLTNSNPVDGLHFSDKNIKMLNDIKAFNYEKIYRNDRLLPSNKYFHLVLTQIYEILKNAYKGKNTIEELTKLQKLYPNFISSFIDWLSRYCDLTNKGRDNMYQNRKLFDIEKTTDYIKSILYYISGMTDNYAIQVYEEIIKF